MKKLLPYLLPFILGPAAALVSDCEPDTCGQNLDEAITLAEKCVDILTAERKQWSEYTRTILVRDDVARDGCEESYSTQGSDDPTSCSWVDDGLIDECCSLEKLHAYRRPSGEKWTLR